MAGALLRSGNLRDFHPLGAVGNPVFSAASQLRAAMRRLIGADIADLFAIPRQHDRGDIIDWYAPEAGDVVPWSAATAEQRQEARATLDRARAQLADHSERLQLNDSSERQVFGRLLGLVTLIPSDEHIYIVGGRPVLTFWGFHPPEAPPGLDVIGSLGAGGPPANVSPGIPAVDATPAGVANTPVVGERRWRWLWWLLIPLLLLLLFFLLPLLLRACGENVPWLPGLPFDVATGTPTPTSSATPDHQGTTYEGHTTASGSATGSDAGTVGNTAGAGSTPPVGAEITPLANPPTDATHPGAQASTPPPRAQDQSPTIAPAPLTPGAQHDTGAKPPDGAGTPGATLPTSHPGQPPVARQTPSGTPLTIPDEAVQRNSTDFLNGQWRSITGLQDRKGNPVELTYDLKNGQGMVSLRRSVGSAQDTCTGRVGSTLKDGTLVIDQSGVRCPDGSVFQDAKVQCTGGADGKAVCRGVNSDGTKYDVNIVK